MRERRIVIYVTSLGDSRMAEWYAVLELENGSSDLRNGGLCELSKVHSAVADELREWSELPTVVGSSSTDGTS